ncbi:rhodanese-related sulfurtransferase, partial [Citrobacter sp. VF227]
HQRGNACERHTNCNKDVGHLLVMQWPACAQEFKGCCSEQCCEESEWPEHEHRRSSAGRENGNKIFNKSRGRLNTKLGIPAPAQ